MSPPPLPVAEAQSRLFALAARMPVERVPLVAAVGRWAAEDLSALRDQPARDLSAMDGYALRYGERPGPWIVAGESAAGAPFGGALGPAEAVRIFTGAAVPAGADCVLMQEEAARDGDRLVLTGEGPGGIGGNIRRRATDFAKGSTLVATGERVDARRVALAAIGGHATIAVRRLPRVALLSTGDELVPLGQPVTEDRLPASNAAMLAALLAGCPAVVEDRGIVRDDLDSIVEAFVAAAETADIVVTTGGVSVGDRDLVRPALAQAGADLAFWRIAMKPGKPLAAGTLGDAVILGLPGNPVSSYVTARLFLQPLIAWMGGAADPLPRRREVALGVALGANGSRQDYLRARIESGRAYAPDGQDSAHLVALAKADGLLVRAPHAPAAGIGDLVDFIDLE